NRRKGGPNVVRRMPCLDRADQQRAATDEEIDTFLLSKRLISRLATVRRLLNKLIVTRPERKLINQVLRLDQITRRMSRAFNTFVLQIERNFGSAMALIGNQE